jgi:gliding motility-associated-like protein
MRNLIFFLSALLFQVNANSQCITNQLAFQTNSTDWALYSNNVGLQNNVQAIVIPYLVVASVYWWDSTAAGNWISCQNSGIHPTSGVGANQSIKYRYEFKACGEDSLKIAMQFFRDNYCNIYLDNNLIFSDPQVPPTNQNNLNVGTNLIAYIINSGNSTVTHYLDFEIIEFNVGYNLNGWGGKMNGTISSVKGNNTIVFNTANCANYTCCSSSSLSISGNTNLCIGDANTLTATAVGTVVWTNLTTNSTTTGNSITISPNANVVYSVVSTDASGCTQNQTVSINVSPPPIVSLTKSNDINCSLKQATLSASGALQYSWSPTPNLNNSNTPVVVATPDVNTVYTVTASNGGCNVTKTIAVFVDSNFVANLNLPNAITPNFDGLNDCFKLNAQKQFKSFKIDIYNRWGQLVFSSQDPNFCWYGEYTNKLYADLGTYFYYINAATDCKEIKQKGDVMIIY